MGGCWGGLVVVLQLSELRPYQEETTVETQVVLESGCVGGVEKTQNFSENQSKTRLNCSEDSRAESAEEEEGNFGFVVVEDTTPANFFDLWMVGWVRGVEGDAWGVGGQVGRRWVGRGRRKKARKNRKEKGRKGGEVRMK